MSYFMQLNGIIAFQKPKSERELQIKTQIFFFIKEKFNENWWRNGFKIFFEKR